MSNTRSLIKLQFITAANIELTMTWSVKLLSLLVLCLAIHWCWNEWHFIQSSETFRHKNVVICGASEGIGEELAYRYSEEGANVILVARREEKLKKVQRSCEILGASSAWYITADLSTMDGAKLVLEKALKQNSTIDVLVLNHVYYNVQRWHGNTDLRTVPKAFDTNVISYINLATLFMPNLQASRGRLVVVSSALGVFTYPYFALYCANKHALHGFFNALRQDLTFESPGEPAMTITIAVLGAIVTDKGLEVGDGNPVAGKSGWTRFSRVDASRAIMKGSLRRERQLYYPLGMLLHELASFHFPSTTDKLIEYVYGPNVQKRQ